MLLFTPLTTALRALPQNDCGRFPPECLMPPWRRFQLGATRKIMSLKNILKLSWLLGLLIVLCRSARIGPLHRTCRAVSVAVPVRAARPELARETRPGVLPGR